jgi:hypothetical protein
MPWVLMSLTYRIATSAPWLEVAGPIPDLDLRQGASPISLNEVIGEEHPARRFLSPLADRIALNREVTGLHYRSDSEAGVRLAD